MLKILERHGARIGYTVTGPEPGAAAALPVVLGHSLLCDGRMWEGVEPGLSAQRTVLNVDVRGHRTSTAPRPFTLEDLADDWLAILDRERIPRAVLCGLSMGAMTAMRVALRAPERVAALVLLDTSAEPEAPAKRVQYRIMVELTRYLGPLAALDPVITKVMFGRTTLRERPELVRREAERIRAHDPHQLCWAVRAVLDRGSILDRLGEIRSPALVLVGEEDLATQPFRSERLAAALPRSTLVKLPRAGHLSALEEPEAVLREIGAFLEAIPEAALPQGASAAPR